jgi:hypothetical protein
MIATSLRIAAPEVKIKSQFVQEHQYFPCISSYPKKTTFTIFVTATTKIVKIFPINSGIPSPNCGF